MSAKKFTRTAINAILNRSDRAVEVGIVRLNQLQTADGDDEVPQQPGLPVLPRSPRHVHGELGDEWAQTDW